MTRFLSILIALGAMLLVSFGAHATHNRAGEITYKHISGYTYEVTILTCTDISFAGNADRQFMPIDWGHVIGPGSNSQDSIERVSMIEVVPGITQENLYTTLHTFPGNGVYHMYTEDPNRNAGVNNIPGSVDQIFSIETVLIIRSDPAYSFNNSVQLLNPPKEDGCVNRLWSHGVNAFDADGDSLAFELIACTGGNNEVVSGYMFPDDYPSPGQNGDMTFDQQFGIVTWDTPQLTGLYNIAIRITEYRYGLKVGHVVRDMQIKIDNCPNLPPVNDPLPDVCVVAGDDLVIQVSATDPEGGQVDLFVEGEPFETSSAQFTDLNTIPASGTIQWTPACTDVRETPYLVYVRSEDAPSNPVLSDNDGFMITVVGPPVQGLSTELEEGGVVTIGWDAYECQNATGFKIHRRVGSNGFDPGACETGLPASAGYDLIATVQGSDVQSYMDPDPPYGSEVCYRVVACFENGVESIVSDEICDTLDAVIPIITHVSVGATDITAGIDTLRWFPPVEIDTLLLFDGPYSYNIYRREMGAEPILVQTTPATASLDIGILEFIDTGLDTESNRYIYTVALMDDGVEVGTSNMASSVFLSAAPSDNSVNLSWTYQVPWINELFDIFQYDEGLAEFIFVGSTTSNEFEVLGLQNNENYCFVVRSSGGYVGTDYEGPFFNFSQEVCALPYDNTPPCPPLVEVSGACEDGTYEVSWQLPSYGCAADVAGYLVYYSPIEGGELELLMDISDVDQISLIDFEGDLYGCFAISAYDSLSVRPDGTLGNNESILSDTLCLESCPRYELPNVFSPNGDGSNDLFQPFTPYAYVDSIDITIYNRWGNIVFHSTDPDIQWSGDNKDSGEQVSDGVYYYTIIIFERSLSGTEPRSMAGYVHLFDNRKSKVE